MSETQILFGILVLIYLSDCVTWIGNSSVLFYVDLVSHWAHRSSSPLGNQKGGIFPLNPLPWSQAVMAYWTPISLSPVGISSFTEQNPDRSSSSNPTCLTLHYSDIAKTSSDGKKLRVNGQHFANCDSATRATSLADLINRLGSMQEEDRTRELRRYYRSTLDSSAAAERFDLVQRCVDPVRFYAFVLFFMLFVAAPALSAAIGFVTILLPTIAIIVGVTVVISISFFRAHKELYPANSTERFSNTLKMLLCPPVAIRAPDLLTLESMAHFHPLLVSFVLSRKSGTFMEAVIRDLLNPLKLGHENLVTEWHLSENRTAIEEFLTRHLPEEVQRASMPPSWDRISKSYCPRCLTQFSHPSGHCSDCRGVALISTPPS